VKKSGNTTAGEQLADPLLEQSNAQHSCIHREQEVRTRLRQSPRIIASASR
jgi:hypothetical protein